MIDEKIIKLLKKKDDWMSIREIAYELELEMRDVKDELKEMFRNKQIQRQKVQTIRGNNYIYKTPENP